MESTDEHTGHDSPPAQTKDNDSPMISDDEDSDDVSGHSFKDEKPPQLSPVPDLETVDTASNSSKQGTDYEITERLASIEIGLPIVSQELLSEFQVVESSIIERIVDQSGSGLDALYTVEFSDGREDVIKHVNLFTFANAEEALFEFMDTADHTQSSHKRRKTYVFDDSSDNEDAASTDSASSASSLEQSLVLRRTRRHRHVVHDSDSVPSDMSRQQRNLRKRERKSVNLTRLSQASVGIVTMSDESDIDPLQDEDDFYPIRSDFALPGRPRRGMARRKPVRVQRRSHNDADVRRSGRATKNTASMIEDDLDDILYDERIVKTSDTPKIHSIKEVFEDIAATSEFGSVHLRQCISCGQSGRRGQLIFCQGCTTAVHKHCLGPRSARDHLVTKVGTDQFVLQCKYCIGTYTKNDKKAPSYSRCQQCKADGRACKAFSKRQTAKQEEKLRLENDGIDPITVVEESLINNGENVLFRCNGCHRAWHQDHLPALGKPSTSDEIQPGTMEDYMVDSTCNQCSAAPGKIHQLVAWRPSDMSTYTPTLVHADISEDEKNYLIKWEHKSHFHCTWVPGSWLYGFAHGTMRSSFAKRAAEQPLCKASEKDAIPADYLTADIIFALKLNHNASMPKTKEAALKAISSVKRMLVRFRGLSYDFVVWDSPPTKEMGFLYEAFQDAYKQYVDGQFFVNEAPNIIRERLRKMRLGKPPQITGQPTYIKGGNLMDYQVEGVNWMLDNFHESKSVILADEMGLGKTVQVISFIATLIHDAPKCYPFLVVVPNATCGNWRREFKQWAPDLRVVSYHGGKLSQEYAYKYELFPNGADDMKAHVVVMSYDSAQDPATHGKFKRVQWAGLVVDEGQRLKNDENQLYTALSAMKIPFQLLLTGTPLQNNTKELFNLLQFIDRNQNAEKLEEEYAVLTKDNLPKLHEKIRPYFLRRTKAGVLTFLPPMRQIIVPVTMTALQAKLSKTIMSKNPQLVKAMFAKRKLTRSEKGSLNNILMQLRKCLCHPFVYSTAIEETYHDAAILHQNLVHASAKLELLDIMLPKLRDNGHRVLIFSQFLTQLDIMEEYMTGMRYNFRRLDGSMSSLQKQQCIEAFNASDSPAFVMLLSTRAGGVGINLATADTVIVMDPDFNPHQDMQAFSRAHRIGQKKSVLCFQLMTKGTVEERIMQMGRRKMALDHALIETMDDENLEADDIESILKHGAEALFNADYQKTAIKYTSAAVDKLLDRSDLVVTTAATTEQPQFPYGQVWDNSKSSLEDVGNIDDDELIDDDASRGFWDKILAQREEEARREAELSQEVLGRGGRRRTDINYNSHGNDLGLDEDTDSQDDFQDAAQLSESDEDVPELRTKVSMPGTDSDDLRVDNAQPVASLTASQRYQSALVHSQPIGLPTNVPTDIPTEVSIDVSKALLKDLQGKRKGKQPLLNRKRPLLTPEDQMAVVNMATRRAMGKTSFRIRLNSVTSLPTQSSPSHPAHSWDPNPPPPPAHRLLKSHKAQTVPLAQDGQTKPEAFISSVVPPGSEIVTITDSPPKPKLKRAKVDGMGMLKAILTTMDPNSETIKIGFRSYLQTISTEAEARIGIDIVGRHMRQGSLKTTWLAAMTDRLRFIVTNKADIGERVRRAAWVNNAAGSAVFPKASSPEVIDLEPETLPKKSSLEIIDLEAEDGD